MSKFRLRRETGKCQSRKVPDLESVRMRKRVRIGKCQNYLEFKDSLQMSQILLKHQFKYMTGANQSLLCNGLYHNNYTSIICPIFKESENSDTFLLLYTFKF